MDQRAYRWPRSASAKAGAESRGVPLHPRVLAALEATPAPKGWVRKGAVFRTNKFKPYADRGRVSGGQIKTSWRTTCKNAGVTNLTPHSLRHTFATWLKAVGTSDHDKDLLMGHASDQMSRLYAHVPRQPLIEAVDRLPSGVEDVAMLSGGWQRSLVSGGEPVG